MPGVGSGFLKVGETTTYRGSRPEFRRVEGETNGSLEGGFYRFKFDDEDLWTVVIWGFYLCRTE